MRSNLKLVVNNPHKKAEEKQFFEKARVENLDVFYSYLITFIFVALTVGSAIFVNK